MRTNGERDILPNRPVVPSMPFVWEQQYKQYPAIGDPGLEYERGDIGDGKYVECLLSRDHMGTLDGVLNYFPFDLPDEKAGDFLIFVRPGSQRANIATTLLKEARRRWDIDLGQQRYTPEGLAFARAFLERAKEQ